MMKKSALVWGFVLGLISQVSAQVTLVEKVEAQPGSMVVPYEMYTLPNGLTLIVSEDHSDPVAHINVTYHVGSAREIPGKSGFAHFFEHMLFQGSQHVADEEHFKIIKEYGGDVNGNTTRDRTVYIETFPSNFTETALWMEADRMGCFLEAYTNEKFEIQRSTVKNEKDQRYNVPYGFLMEVKDQELYPSDHPYSWSTIGFVDDLDRADSNDLRNFFLRWYGPNNACVIVSGDVNVAEVVAWTEKYFGSIQAGPEVRKQRVRPVVLKENKIASYSDPNANLPLIYTTYVGAPVMSSDEAALDMLSYLWGNTRNSPLYQRFVDKEWAIQVGANNNPLSAINHELAGEFSFIVVGYPWSDINGLRNMMATAIDSFEYVNFSDEDLERAKINMLSNLSSGLEGASTKASYLSMFWYLDARGADGKLTNLEAEAERIKSVTREDIMRVYRQYIKTKKSSTVVIEPARSGADGEKPKYQSFNPNADYRNPVAEAEYKGLQYRPVQDDFDRSVRPEPSAVKEVAVPQVQKTVLKNGLEVWTSPFDETPRVFVRMSIDGGALLEDGKTIPAGTADMLSMALQNGTAKRTPAELEQEMERLGASINIGAGATSMYVTLGCEKQNLEAAAALMREMLFEPRWDSDEYSKEKKRAVESANSDLLNRGTGASNAWSRLTQGDNSLGTYVGASQYEKVQLSHCQTYWEKYFSPSVSKLVVVGSVNQEEVLQYFSFLSDWKGKPVEIPMPANNYDFQTSQIFGVEYVDAKQSDIYIGFKTLPYDATGDFYKASVMNFALAGNFNSRLNLKIREEKAWTYGIRGGFSAGYKDLPGTYVISAGVKSEATDSAIVEILNVLETYKTEGITDEEFAFTKSALIASEALDYESLFQKAGFILSMANRGLSEDYTAQQLATLQSMTKEEFNALAKQYLNTDELIIVVAGDMLRLEEKLNNLGFGTVQRLNKDGSGKIKLLKAGTTGHKKNYN